MENIFERLTSTSRASIIQSGLVDDMLSDSTEGAVAYKTSQRASSFVFSHVLS